MKIIWLIVIILSIASCKTNEAQVKLEETEPTIDIYAQTNLPITLNDEELALEANFIGKYIFSSTDIIESENIDISIYKNIGENIYIEIIKVDAGKYKLESNLWLINSILRGYDYKPPENVEFEQKPIIFIMLWKNTDFKSNKTFYDICINGVLDHEGKQVIFSYNNGITMNYFHFKPIEMGSIDIKGFNEKTFSPLYFSREKEIIKCNMFFKKDTQH